VRKGVSTIDLEEIRFLLLEVTKRIPDKLSRIEEEKFAIGSLAKKRLKNPPWICTQRWPEG